MIRLLFVLFVTLGGFAAAALLNSRDRDAGDAPQSVAFPEPGSSIADELERLDLPDATARLLATANQATAAIAQRNPLREARIEDEEPAGSSGENPGSAADPQTRESPAAPTPAIPPTSDTETRSLAGGGAGGALAPENDDEAGDAEREVSEDVVTPPSEFARDLGVDSDTGVETDAAQVDEAVRFDSLDWQQDASPHDSDRSARLIRRMLALYRSTGAER